MLAKLVIIPRFCLILSSVLISFSMIDQIIDFNSIKTHPLVPKDIVVRGFIIDSETGALEEIK